MSGPNTQIPNPPLIHSSTHPSPALQAWRLPFDSHNGRVLKLAVILACALVVVTGCNTAPPRSPKHSQPPPDWGLPATNEPTPQVVTTNPPPAPTNAIPTVISPPKTNPPPPSQPEATWLSLERWARERGLERLRRTATNPVPGFALPTPHGVLTLRPGTLSAGWDGVNFRLGFAPQLVDGRLFIHALDLRKNIGPLVLGNAPPDAPGKVIVIDPGHGGSDPGTQSSTEGLTEKTMALDWALRTARLLEEKGWRVGLTRTNDVEVPRAQRVAFAEMQRADLFVSLHFNSSGGNGGEGLETYCLTPAGMASSLTRGYDDNPAQSFPNNAFDEPNFLLALQVHRAVLKATGQADRGVRRARFPTVLQGQNRPAVLVEGGYLSNPAEARRIGDAAFRQKLAKAVAEAIGGISEAGVQASELRLPASSLGNTNGR